MSLFSAHLLQQFLLVRNKKAHPLLVKFKPFNSKCLHICSQWQPKNCKYKVKAAPQNEALTFKLYVFNMQSWVHVEFTHQRWFTFTSCHFKGHVTPGSPHWITLTFHECFTSTYMYVLQPPRHVTNMLGFHLHALLQLQGIKGVTPTGDHWDYSSQYKHNGPPCVQTAQQQIQQKYTLWNAHYVV